MSNQPVTRRDPARAPANPASPHSSAGTPHPRSTPSQPALDLPRSQRLSPYKVRRVVCIGQRWSTSDGESYRVAQVYRADGMVLLQTPGERALHRASFEVLGRRYRREVS
jgi:hypothetical protein